MKDKQLTEQNKICQSLINCTKYRESMCIELIEMFKQGMTAAQFCSRYNIGKETYHKWKKKHKLFGLACDIGEQHARSYYDDMRHKHLLEAATGCESTLNWGAFNKMYSARFNIADKRTVTVNRLSKATNEREMLQSLMKAIEDGELTPDEAMKLSCLITVSLKVTEIQELEKRLTTLETYLKEGINDYEEVKEL